MISIKHFLDQYRDEPATELGLVNALKQMGRLLLDCMALHSVRGSEADCDGLRETLNGLASQIDQPQDALGFLSIASEADEALKNYCCQTTDYLRAEKERVNSMVGMLTGTLVEVIGQADSSINRLHAIEKDLEEASGLTGMQAIRPNLEKSLLALHAAVMEQKNSSAAARERLNSQLAKSGSSTSRLQAAREPTLPISTTSLERSLLLPRRPLLPASRPSSCNARNMSQPGSATRQSTKRSCPLEGY